MKGRFSRENEATGRDLSGGLQLPDFQEDVEAEELPRVPAVNRKAISRMLEGAGFKVMSSERLAHGAGVKFAMQGGAVVTVSSTGRFEVRAKRDDPQRTALDVALWSYFSPPLPRKAPRFDADRSTRADD